ncbi:2383_t:CDS:1 [Diversispora eburnea]|uniref:2383_t:CDS:1 n=1 Tax=Diversispora eburnea TaxID=1213867 RepID=A0A9N9ARX0_9GLOM|nr:2383_t:CDS:1 [Diversispora eburnea]
MDHLHLIDPLITVDDLIHYTRDSDVKLSGKNALFIQIFRLKGLLAKDLYIDLWNLASPDQRRAYENLANDFNVLNKDKKRRLNRRNNNNNDMINGFNFP